MTAEDDAEYELLGASEENREVRAMELTWADEMAAKYQAMAEAKYQAERQKQEAERQKQEAEYLREIRRLLLRVLELRFGPPAPEIRQQIEAIGSLDRLHRLADQVVAVRSPEEIPGALNLVD